MKLRIAKKRCKKAIREMGLEIIATHNRTFVVKAKPNFVCMRWYVYIVVAENHPQLQVLIDEGKLSLCRWRMVKKTIK